MGWFEHVRLILLVAEERTAAVETKYLNTGFESENDLGMVQSVESGQRFPHGEHHGMGSWVGRR